MKPEHITLYIVLFLMMIGSTCIEHYRFKKHNKGKLTKFLVRLSPLDSLLWAFSLLF